MKKQLNSQSQRDHAYRVIRRLLVLDKIPQGKRLKETEWAPDLGVNRAALREAFARLEAEGLIEKGPRTGYFVPTLNQKDMEEILAVRAMLESGAARLICQSPRLCRESLERMAKTCDELEVMIQEGYSLGVSEADRRFHEVLIDAPGNRRLSMLYHRAPLPMLHRDVVHCEQWAEHARLSLKDHRLILKALIAGHGEEAAHLLADHLDKRYLLPLAF